MKTGNIYIRSPARHRNTIRVTIVVLCLLSIILPVLAESQGGELSDAQKEDLIIKYFRNNAKFIESTRCDPGTTLQTFWDTHGSTPTEFLNAIAALPVPKKDDPMFSRWSGARALLIHRDYVKRLAILKEQVASDVPDIINKMQLIHATYANDFTTYKNQFNNDRGILVCDFPVPPKYYEEINAQRMRIDNLFAEYLRLEHFANYLRELQNLPLEFKRAAAQSYGGRYDNLRDLTSSFSSFKLPDNALGPIVYIGAVRQGYMSDSDVPFDTEIFTLADQIALTSLRAKILPVVGAPYKVILPTDTRKVFDYFEDMHESLRKSSCKPNWAQVFRENMEKTVLSSCQVPALVLCSYFSPGSLWAEFDSLIDKSFADPLAIGKEGEIVKTILGIRSIEVGSVAKDFFESSSTSIVGGNKGDLLRKLFDQLGDKDFQTLKGFAEKSSDKAYWAARLQQHITNAPWYKGQVPGLQDYISSGRASGGSLYGLSTVFMIGSALRLKSAHETALKMQTFRQKYKVLEALTKTGSIDLTEANIAELSQAVADMRALLVRDMNHGYWTDTNDAVIRPLVNLYLDTYLFGSVTFEKVYDDGTNNPLVKMLDAVAQMLAEYSGPQGKQALLECACLAARGMDLDGDGLPEDASDKTYRDSLNKEKTRPCDMCRRTNNEIQKGLRQSSDPNTWEWNDFSTQWREKQLLTTTGQVVGYGPYKDRDQDGVPDCQEVKFTCGDWSQKSGEKKGDDSYTGWYEGNAPWWRADPVKYRDQNSNSLPDCLEDCFKS